MNHTTNATTWPVTLEHDEVLGPFVRGADDRAIPLDVFKAECLRRAHELRRASIGEAWSWFPRMLSPMLARALP